MLVSGTRMCLQQSSGCLGGYVRPPPAALPEKVPQRKHRRWSKRRVRGQSAHSPQSWWMSSSNEMDDHSVLNSRSLQKLSKATNFCQDAGSHRNNTNSNISNNSTFVNHGNLSLSHTHTQVTSLFLIQKLRWSPHDICWVVWMQHWFRGMNKDETGWLRRLGSNLNLKICGNPSLG